MKNTIYGKIGVRYNEHRTADKRILNAIKCLLNLPLESNIADIGGGTGNYSNGLADLGFRVNAAEPSIEMRHQAVQNNNVIWFEGFNCRLLENCKDKIRALAIPFFCHQNVLN
jgi:2-polyprenyl-3-methyl-5-hydroxy-6-metoxy-1,4-benzoquinol methylase